MQCRNIAVKIIETAAENGFNSAGKDPKGIAAAAIYIGSGVVMKIALRKRLAS